MSNKRQRNLDVQHERSKTGGEFSLYDDSRRLGEMTWIEVSPGRVAFNHTWISPAARGENLGKVLVDKGAEFARDNDLKVDPTCPYVAHIFDRYDTYRDIDGRGD
jgi:predicted GNAT family acetyltransferase